MNFASLIEQGLAERFNGGVLTSSPSLPLLVSVPKALRIEVAGGVDAQILLLHEERQQSVIDIVLHEDSHVQIADIYTLPSFAEINIEQYGASTVETTIVELCGANVSYHTRLLGAGASCQLGGMFIATGSEHATLSIETRHEVADCTSNSIVKGIAAARATGEFRGLVYVAKDAQRTDARQQSRNIEIGGGHIITKPQLEIYADDVRCTHGATVGNEDTESIYYMRQRGLSEADARRLQIEGFVNDIVVKCPIDVAQKVMAEQIAEVLASL